MKLALVTTTIREPKVLALYRRLDPNGTIRFFVVGDRKSPHQAINDLCYKLGNAVYLHPDDQARYKCSKLIGWNCIQRRNIAILEALRWGATHIYTMDDDNVPIDRAHFINLSHAFEDFDGPAVHGDWFDVGELLHPRAKHRGFPIDIHPLWAVRSITEAKVGVAAGICLGDPDIDAVTRIVNHPEVHGVSELLRGGIVVDRQTTTVFNSQNTAFVRELAPAMFLWPGFGRYDDIYASLVTQRIARELNYHVHFGKPFVWQARNAHNLLDDLAAEIDGMSRVRTVATMLDNIPLPPNLAPVAMMRYLLHTMQCVEQLPLRSIEAGYAWCDDIEQAMTELPL